MSLFDRLRPKWKHPAPAVREAGVRELANQAVLESIADNDPSEAVRLAAVQTLADQVILARFARSSSPFALAAMERLTDPRQVEAVALGAESRAVRELAVDRINDGEMLHRISNCDTAAWVRLKARMKSLGRDQTRAVIKGMLSNLQLAQQQAAAAAEFSGSLEDVCGALMRDRRFRVNGGGIEDPSPMPASLPERASVAAGAASAAISAATTADSCAQFVAFKRGDTGDSEDTAKSKAFYQIKIWRTAQDAYAGSLEEKRLELTPDALAWSRASNEHVTHAEFPPEPR